LHILLSKAIILWIEPLTGLLKFLDQMSLLIYFPIQTKGIQRADQMPILLIGQFHHLHPDALIDEAVLLYSCELCLWVGQREGLFLGKIFGLVEEVGVPGAVHRGGVGEPLGIQVLDVGRVRGGEESGTELLHFAERNVRFQ
jgi:hypothetical protein